MRKGRMEKEKKHEGGEKQGRKRKTKRKKGG